MVGRSARTNCKSTIITTENKITVIVASGHEYFFFGGRSGDVTSLYVMVQDKVTAYSNWIMPYFLAKYLIIK